MYWVLLISHQLTWFLSSFESQPKVEESKWLVRNECDGWCMRRRLWSWRVTPAWTCFQSFCMSFIDPHLYLVRVLTCQTKLCTEVFHTVLEVIPAVLTLYVNQCMNEQPLKSNIFFGHTSLMCTAANELKFTFPLCLIFKMKIERLGLRLTEDRVPANITSPGSIPTEVWLPKLLVKRSPEGVFTLLPQKEGGWGPSSVCHNLCGNYFSPESF